VTYDAGGSGSTTSSSSGGEPREVESGADAVKVSGSSVVDRTATTEEDKEIELEARRRSQRLQAKALFRSAKKNMQLADAELFEDGYNTDGANDLRAALSADMNSLRAVAEFMSSDEREMMVHVGATVEKLGEVIKIREAQRAQLMDGKESEASEDSEGTEGQSSSGESGFGSSKEGGEKALGSNLKRRLSTVGAKVEESVSSFVKPDGSVDFGALKSSVELSVERFGETWARLNGLAPGEQVRVNRVMESYVESPIVWKLREEIESLEQQLSVLSKARETRLRREDQLGKLIRAKEIRAMDDEVNEVRRTLALRVLQLEMERIYLYLEAEADEIPAPDLMEERLLAVEFGELDLRVAELRLLIAHGDGLLVQDDELGDLASDILDFKSRLGLDSDLYTKRLDAAKVRKVLSTTLAKARIGWEFYVRGFKLIGGDLWYAWKLLRKAAFGSTLSRREVRMLRRTSRDLFTLIPFTIILIIPLSPVGHVLVFSFIQRFFPDFFPSTFSERRQETMKRYEVMRSNLEANSSGASAAPGLDSSGKGSDASGEQTEVAASENSTTADTVDATAERVLEDVRRQTTSRASLRSTLLDDLHLGD